MVFGGQVAFTSVAKTEVAVVTDGDRFDVVAVSKAPEATLCISKHAAMQLYWRSGSRIATWPRICWWQEMAATRDRAIGDGERP